MFRLQFYLAQETRQSACSVQLQARWINVISCRARVQSSLQSYFRQEQQQRPDLSLLLSGAGTTVQASPLLSPSLGRNSSKDASYIQSCLVQEQQYKQASPLGNLSWAELPETGTASKVSPLSSFALGRNSSQISLQLHVWVRTTEDASFLSLPCKNRGTVEAIERHVLFPVVTCRGKAAKAGRFQSHFVQ